MKCLVRPIALRIHAGLPAQIDLDDLMQQGYLGLIDAMNRFDRSRNIRFEAFSRQRIAGALQDYLRAIDPVPRMIRKRSKQANTIIDRFLKHHGRPPSDAELLNTPGIEPAEARRMLADAQVAVTINFSHALPDAGQDDSQGDADAMDGFQDQRTPSPTNRLIHRDLQRWLLRTFDRRDRLIIVLYYYESMTMREIGQTLGICESRVSQRLDSILECLRAKLDPQFATELLVFQ